MPLHYKQGKQYLGFREFFYLRRMLIFVGLFFSDAQRHKDILKYAYNLLIYPKKSNVLSLVIFD